MFIKITLDVKPLEVSGDGTLDTVLECPYCQERMTFFTEEYMRDENGFVDDHWLEGESTEHYQDECQAFGEAPSSLMRLP